MTTNPLQKLVITKEAHPKLYHFLNHHPEIFEVFHNIEKDRSLDTGVLLARGDSKDIVKVYIDHLHVPLLLEHQAIGANSARRCGYEPLVSGLEFLGYDSVRTAQVVADRAQAVSRIAKPSDNRENSLYCYYHGSDVSMKVSGKLLDKIRALIVDFASNPGEADANEVGMSFDFIVSARISKDEKK